MAGSEEPSDAEKMRRAFAAALDALGPTKKEEPAAPPAAQAAVPAATEPPHVHSFKEQADGSLFCSDCNTKAVVSSGPEDVIHSLNSVYHKRSHDWVNCPDCRAAFDKELTDEGYTVKDEKGVITISGKKK